MGMPKYDSCKLKMPDNAIIEYVDIKGPGTTIILIPGAGDGINTVGKFPYPYTLARMFKNYAKKHRLIIMSRREPVPKDYSVRDFAKDYLWAMDQIGIGKAHVDDKFRGLLQQWIDWCKSGDWYKLHVDSILKTYTPKYYGKYKWAFPLMHLMPKPKNPNRMIRIFEGLLYIDNRQYLKGIKCPTLVIGGDVDQVTRPELQKEMEELIPDARQVIIPGVGHGENQEAIKEHEVHVLSFYDEVEKS